LPCGCNDEVQPPRIGYYPRSVGELLNVRRVVLVELGCDGTYTGVAREMTAELFRAIQDKKLFHVRLIRRNDPLCRDLPLDCRQGYTVKQLAQIQQALHCDAVLLGRIDHFRPHPRMQVAVYLLLMDLKDGRAIWVVDHTWDTTDEWTVARVKRFFQSQMRQSYDPVNWRLALRSPRIFEKFVAYEISNTLPGAGLPGPPQKRPPPASWLGL